MNIIRNTYTVFKDFLLLFIASVQIIPIINLMQNKIQCHISPIVVHAKLDTIYTTQCTIMTANGDYLIDPSSFRIDSIRFVKENECFGGYFEPLKPIVKLKEPNIPYIIMSDKCNFNQFELSFKFDVVNSHEKIDCIFNNEKQIGSIYISFDYKHNILKNQMSNTIPIILKIEDLLN